MASREPGLPGHPPRPRGFPPVSLTTPGVCAPAAQSVSEPPSWSLASPGIHSPGCFLGPLSPLSLRLCLSLSSVIFLGFPSPASGSLPIFISFSLSFSCFHRSSPMCPTLIWADPGVANNSEPRHSAPAHLPAPPAATLLGWSLSPQRRAADPDETGNWQQLGPRIHPRPVTFPIHAPQSVEGPQESPLPFLN